MIYLCLLLLISPVDIDYPDSSTTWPLGYFAPLRRGYGQYNSIADFHRALDFHASVGELVRAPYPEDGGFWVLRVATQQDTIIDDPVEGSVLIGRGGPYTCYGWHYGHIDVNHDRFLLEDSTYYNRVIISELVVLLNQGSHVHFSWLGIDSYEDPFEQPGYFNPIDYLTRYMGLFNVAEFSPTDSGPCKAFASITGICFATEGVENVAPPQNRVRDVIDIIVRPYTYFYQNPANDSCIARRVEWRLVWQHPDSCVYQPYNSSLLGTWRTLYDFSVYIYDDNDDETPLPEYLKVFFGGDKHWSNNICLTNTCETPRDDASFPGVETVWINPYNRQSDYDDDEFCRGGWDTRLCTFDDGNPAYTDEAAAFFDGRYAIDVIAIPQRFDNKTLRRLPVDDITLPEPEVTGIIVDNWAPRIAEISLIENGWQTIRWGQYETNEPNNQNTGRTLSYIHPYGTFPYITTGSGINEYELQIDYSEPVKSLTSNIALTIRMVTGPDSTVNWNDSLDFVLDTLCYNANGECTRATYYATGYQPPGYVGHQIVEMTITDEFAYDLAENGLDADASTIAPAWGEGGSDNYENTFDFIEDLNTFYGYYREESIEQDSRSRVIYAYYDRIYNPTDERDSLVWIKNDFTLTGELYDAELFNEVNFMGIGNNLCSIYGGAWMCDNDDNVLHLYIVDYQGTIKKDEVFFNPDSSEYTDILISEVTTPSYWSGNPYEDPIWELDRYGWLGWRKLTPFTGDNSREESNNREDAEEMYLPQGNRNVPEDFESDNREDIYRRDVEISYTVCDAYTGQDVTESLVNGHQWFNTDELKWYRTTISNMHGIGNDGAVSITTRTYNYPNTNPEYHTDTFTAPGVKSCDALSLDNLYDAGIAPQDIEISNYFSVFPNPAKGSVSIEFMTSEVVDSTVRIYDISGHLVITIAEELPGMRNHNLLWNLQDASGHIVPTGIYYVSLVSDSFEKTRTVIVCH